MIIVPVYKEISIKSKFNNSCGSGQRNMVENNTFACGNDRNIIWKVKTNMFSLRCKLKHLTG